MPLVCVCVCLVVCLGAVPCRCRSVCCYCCRQYATFKISPDGKSFGTKVCDFKLQVMTTGGGAGGGLRAASGMFKKGGRGGGDRGGTTTRTIAKASVDLGDFCVPPTEGDPASGADDRRVRVRLQ